MNIQRTILLMSLLCIAELSNAQTWTKISSNLDSLWTASVKYFNKGDTIIHYGSKTGTGAANAKQFYVSTNGGYNFTRDFTKLDAIGYQAIYPLPQNNTLIGFKNSPNAGSYSFSTTNSWSTLLAQYTGLWGEINAGNLVFQAAGTSNLFTVSYPSGVITANTTTLSTELICTYNIGNRLLLGGKKNNVIKYVDSGNFGAVQTATIENLGLGASVLRFFESGSKLYAVVFDGQDKLYKSIDNGASWTLQTTNFFKNNALQQYLVSTFTLGTPNGNIFFLTNAGNSDDVYLSTDGGVTANKVGTGLPTNGTKIGPTIGKLLSNGNKVWYQVCAARITDYVTTDTNIAGLYLFSGGSTGLNATLSSKEKFSVYTSQANSQLFVNYPGEIKSYRIYSSEGRQIEHQNFFEQSIVITNLKSGFYFIEIMTAENKKLTAKFIKN